MIKKYIKKHLVLNVINQNEISRIIRGQFAIYFINGGRLNYNVFKSLIFFFKKKFKFFSKLFIRIYPTIKNTCKSIGIRMGKGKGGLNEYYLNISKGQIFIEFGFGNKLLLLTIDQKLKLLEYLNYIVYIAQSKSKIKFKLLYNQEKWF